MASHDEIREHNRRSWNSLVAKGDRWTVPVTAAEIARARAGDWSVVLTPKKPVPRQWFGDIAGAKLLGLASAGGQQCPIFSAAGAKVTVYDNSPAQLKQDRAVAEREGLDLECVEGDMADLSALADDSFDLVFHPCSNVFVENVRPVWREVHRVLRPGGAILAGICSPVMFLFDDAKLEAGELVVRHSLPYSDLTSLSEDERLSLYGNDEPLSFGHTLTDQIGGQLDAGLVLTGFYEDTWGPPDEAASENALDAYIASFIATRAIKPVR